MARYRSKAASSCAPCSHRRCDINHEAGTPCAKLPAGVNSIRRYQALLQIAAHAARSSSFSESELTRIPPAGTALRSCAYPVSLRS